MILLSLEIAGHGSAARNASARPSDDACEWFDASEGWWRMTSERFRRVALGLDGAIEHAHHGHPDFRVGGRIFATLGYPDRGWGMVNLTPDQQRTWVREHPDAFVPVRGKWGEQGSTTVRLDAVDEETLGEALTLAWQNVAARGRTRAPARKPRTALRLKADKPRRR